MGARNCRPLLVGKSALAELRYVVSSAAKTFGGDIGRL